MQATLEHMTIWGLISDASLLVKAVMLTLLLASLLSWYLIIQRSRVLRRRERGLNSFMQRFRSAPELLPLLRGTAQVKDVEAGIEAVFRAGFQEFCHLKQQAGHHPDVVQEGVERALHVNEAFDQLTSVMVLATLQRMRADLPGFERSSRQLIELAAVHSMPFWGSLGEANLGWLAAMRGDDSGLPLLKGGDF